MRFDLEQQKRVRKSKNLSRFRTHYTGSPMVYATLWERLQLTNITEARIDPFIEKVGLDKAIDYFFMGIHLLACYPKEEEAEGTFAHCDRTWSDWAWAHVKKINLLVSEVIVWPPSFNNPDNEADPTTETIFIITVDGTHCKIEEPTLSAFNKNKSFYSHKFNAPGLDYEIAISVHTGDCIWVSGPFPAGCPDIKVFRQENGLKTKMMEAQARSGLKQRGIGDKGYHGESLLLVVPSSHDTDEVREFKSRALARHETFNSRLKNFDCLDERFRHHSFEKHQQCFFACAVITQLHIENGHPLFTV